ncbi:MAG: hypothetical protein N2689_15225, partial [Verrucomicrobiae bacterium]|nr:hypothetical protein [Verrucomicrobiae bacterium]
DKPVYPPPRATLKFAEARVSVEHDPTVLPLEVESRVRWRTERELERAKPGFTLGQRGLLIHVKFLHFIEPQRPFPARRVPRVVPAPKGRGQIYIGPEAEMQPIPPMGQARIQLTFSAPDGTQLAQFDFLQPVPVRDQIDDELGYIAQTAKIASHYARHYFFEEKPKETAPKKK